jgi:hypothetical protein
MAERQGVRSEEALAAAREVDAIGDPTERYRAAWKSVLDLQTASLLKNGRR